MTQASAIASAAAPSTSLAAGLCQAVPGLTAATGLRRLTGGSSHETWSFDGVFEGESVATPLILRREFSHSLFEMSSQTEFALMNQLYQAGAPVPRPVFGAQADNPLGTPFMVIERVPATDARKAMAQGGLNPGQQARALIAALAGIHALEPSICVDILSGGESSIDQLPQWSESIRLAEVGGMVQIAVDWLERNAFRIEDLVIVHGDFKANNILVDDAGRVTIIDWELAHLGDPLEDLAWTALWSTPADLVTGMVEQSEFLHCYTELARRSIDTGKFRYWQIFALVKLAAIFLKGLEGDGNGPPRPMLLMLDQALPCIEEALARLLNDFAGEHKS